MTDVIVSRGDTFPRALLDTYRQSRAAAAAAEAAAFYCELKSSKSDELVLQATSSGSNVLGGDLCTTGGSGGGGIHGGSAGVCFSGGAVNSETALPPMSPGDGLMMGHGHSETTLLLPDAKCMSPTEPDFLDKPDVLPLLPAPRGGHRRKVSVYDRVDPEDSIRDIVTENDFYRFVLFKKHYEKYLHLSQKYEEARNIAYYLEEKYHEVKNERDDLLQQREQLSKRLESNECLLREKEDDVFAQFERVVFLEEQCDKLRAEKEKSWEQKQRIEKERDEAFRLLKDQATESESNRRKLERARQEVFRHMTKIKHERDSLERENDQLKEELQAEREERHHAMRRRHHQQQLHKNQTQHPSHSGRSPIRLQSEPPPDRSGATYASMSTAVQLPAEAALRSQFQKAMAHLASCKRRKCSVCAYTRAAFGKLNKHPNRHDKRLFSCLQTPFLEVRNMLKPPPSPLRTASNTAGSGGNSTGNSGGTTRSTADRRAEAVSLSEWFCPLHSDDEEPDDMLMTSSFHTNNTLMSTNSSGSRRCCGGGTSSFEGGSSSANNSGVVAADTNSNCSTLNVPFANLTMSYMDDTGSELRDDDDAHEGDDEDDEDELVQLRYDQDVLSHVANSSTRGFGSDSGFSSDMCEYKSNATTPREKFSPRGTLDEAECAKLTRTKWTASFRKLINRIKK